MVCVKCGDDFVLVKGKPGKSNECPFCSEETAVKYTGNVIYDHKTSAMLQINKDPALTAYINKSTRLQNKGSNLGNNLKVDSRMSKSNGACLLTVDRLNYKGRV